MPSWVAVLWSVTALSWALQLVGDEQSCFCWLTAEKVSRPKTVPSATPPTPIAPMVRPMTRCGPRLTSVTAGAGTEL